MMVTRDLRTPDSSRTKRTGRLLVAALAVAAVWAAQWQGGLARASEPVALGGMIIEPNGEGARLRIAVGRATRYTISTLPERVAIVLDGVVVEPVSYQLVFGPVVGIVVRRARGAGGQTEIDIATRTPAEATATLSREHVLVVTIAPRSAPAAAGDTNGLVPRASDAPARSPAPAPQPALPLPVAASDARRVTLEEGTGRLFSVEGLVRVAVADPRVLGVVPVSSRELLATARAAGRTTMYIWDRANRVWAYAVQVTPAPDRLAALRRLFETVIPKAAITVTEVPADAASAGGSVASIGPGVSGGLPPSGVSAHVGSGQDAVASQSGSLAPDFRSSLPSVGAGNPTGIQSQGSSPQGYQRPFPSSSAVVLSGSVETQMDRQRAEEIARAFVSTVVDLLVVRRPVQIKLQVEVVELDRSAAHSLGVTWGGGEEAPGAAPSLNGGLYNLQLITSPGTGTAGLDLLIAQLQALVQQGRAKLLAEPSLVVMAGTTASMLLGGQVPIPIAGPNGSVTVEYKDFGVILTARPDYQDDGRVFMQVEPEVSTLDFTDAIRVSGFTIPALRVRRAQTTVSMLPAETLVLGGLLQHQDSASMQKLPLLGDLPVIGPLFRSTQFQREETDLVIFVTPLVVETNDEPEPRP